MKQRFYSLDVFRGATVALMILVNNPGSWDYIYTPLEHAPWHGCTPTDLVFPFFLFAMGNALSFVMPGLEKAGDAVFLKKVFRRSLLIFGIGLFLNWFPFIKWSGNHLVFKAWTEPADILHPDADATGIRILGVLQRIALTYFFASLIIYYGKIKAAFVWVAIILLGYWGLCLQLGTPGDPYSLAGYFGTRVDKTVLGTAHMYKGEGVAFDPEGLISTLPAIAQVILGYLVGHFISQMGKTYEMITRLFVIGCVLIFIGLCWNMVFPFNKKIWSSSFVVYTNGLAILTLCVLLYLIEMRDQRGAWSRFFDVFGKNALFIFVVSGIVGRMYGLFHIADGKDMQGAVIYKGLKEWMYDHIFFPAFGAINGSLMYAVFHIIIFWALCYSLDKKKIYIKV